MRIICDFDGTISRYDTVDAVLEHLADPAWREIEERWLANEITAAECMRAQIALIDGADGRLESLLDQVELDPGFAGFVDWAEAAGVPITIVSDGVDYFVRRILARHGFERLPVIANHLVRGERLSLEQPWAREGCAAGSGVCKCDVSSAADPDLMIYIGDGRSDFCASGKADVLFAKSKLAVYAAERGRPFHEYSTFDDVTPVLEQMTEAGRRFNRLDRRVAP